MIVNENNSMPYMKSLSTCLNKMVNDGYTEDFKVTDDGLKSENKPINYKPDEINVVNYFRFQGESDPDDNAILYVIETSDGTRGTLVDAYGVYNDPKVSNFMEEVNNIKKQVVKN